jgi:hypothetical protein
VSFASITICVASQRVFIVVYFVIGSVRKVWIQPRTRRHNPEDLGYNLLGLYIIKCVIALV